MLCGIVIIPRTDRNSFHNINSDMWPLQSYHSAQKGLGKWNIYTCKSKLSGKVQKKPVPFKADQTKSAVQVLCALFGLAVCVCVGYESGNLLLYSTLASRSCHSKHNMGLAHFSSISCMSGISSLILFCCGWRENYRWAWKTREERNDWHSGFSLRWPAERNLISIYTNHCPGTRRTHVCRSEGQEHKKFKSALHFCIK